MQFNHRFYGNVLIDTNKNKIMAKSLLTCLIIHFNICTRTHVFESITGKDMYQKPHIGVVLLVCWLAHLFAHLIVILKQNILEKIVQ